MRQQLLVAVALLLLTLGQLAGQVTYVEHGPFSAMLDTYTELNRDDTRRLTGVRIQIVSTTDRLKMENVQREFEAIYPQYPVDWIHEKPFYKLRTGAFTDRKRATEFLYAIKRNFPSAYPTVARDIRPSELLRY